MSDTIAMDNGEVFDDIDFDKLLDLDVEIPRVEMYELQHQFRNESEVRKESKGDYLKGNIILSDDLANPENDFTMILSLAPRKPDPENTYDIHPNLLHLKADGKKKGKKEAKKVVVPSRTMTNRDWKLILRKMKNNDGKVVLVAQDRGNDVFVALDGGERVTGEDVTEALSGNRIMLGHDGAGVSKDSKEHVKKGLRINIIKAGQKNTQNAQSRDGVILDRLTEATGATGGENELRQSGQFQYLQKHFKFSGADEDKVSMHMARLKVELPSRHPSSSFYSMPIRNTNSNFTADLAVIDLLENRLCERGNKRLTLELKSEISHKYVRAFLRVKRGAEQYEIDCEIKLSGKIGIVTIPSLSEGLSRSTVELVLRQTETECTIDGLLLYFKPHHEEGSVGGTGYCFCKPKEYEEALTNGAPIKPKKSVAGKRKSSSSATSAASPSSSSFVSSSPSSSSSWSSGSPAAQDDCSPPSSKRPSTEDKEEGTERYVMDLNAAADSPNNTNDAMLLPDLKDVARQVFYEEDSSSTIMISDAFWGSHPSTAAEICPNSNFNWSIDDIKVDGGGGGNNSVVDVGPTPFVSSESRRKRSGLVTSKPDRIEDVNNKKERLLHNTTRVHKCDRRQPSLLHQYMYPIMLVLIVAIIFGYLWSR